MKQAKKPTLEQKKIMALKGIDWKQYNIREDRETFLVIVHKENGKERLIQK